MGNGSVEVNLLHIDLKPQIKKIRSKIATETAGKIADNSPIGYTGKYERGWTSVDVDDENSVVYNNGKHKSLSHLLELGHRAKNGKTVPPQEHIRPAYLQQKKKYLDELQKIKIESK